MKMCRALVIALLSLFFAAPAASAQSSGLVAAYGFEEGTGAAAVDSSGAGNAGTLAGPTWSASGRFGGALSFDGTNDRVNVNDSASLDLSSAMTLEAWIRPEAGGWRTALIKERPGGLAYALWASTDSNRSSSEVQLSSTIEARSTSTVPMNVWTHLATTYDGATLRLYVNGGLMASRAASGAINISSGALRIGGNAVWGEYFRGLLDEVRIYNRALTIGEIQTDMNAAIVSGGGDTQAPTAPALTASRTGNDVHLAWSGAADNVGITGYRIFRDGTLLTTVAASASSFDDLDRPYGTYRYTVRAIDAAGNVGAVSNEAPITYADPDAGSPTAPALTASLTGGDDVHLSWTAANDDLGVASYRLYRDGAPHQTLSASTLSFDFVDEPAGSVTYKLVAVDASGHTSPESNTANVTVAPDTQAPTAPELTATVSGHDVHLTWSAAADERGIDAYRVTRRSDGQTLATVGASVRDHYDLGLAEGVYEYDVRAIDKAGNVGPASNVASATVGTPDLAPPTAPVVSASVTGRTVGLGWTASTDDRGIQQYDVFRDGTLIATVGPDARTLSDANVAFGTHRYTVRALDTAGKASPLSNETVVDVVDPDAEAPTAPVLSATVVNENDIELSWTASSDDLAVAGYRLYLDGLNYWGTFPASKLTFKEFDVSAGTYHFTLRAVDGSGHLSPVSNEAVVTVEGDTTPPTAPVVSASVEADGVHLSWTESIDEGSGVDSYEVYRLGAIFGDRSARLTGLDASARSYVDRTSLPTDTTYRYRVYANDRMGNRSSSFVDVRVGDPDLEPPTAPVLTVTNGALSWTAATDDHAIMEYAIYVDGRAVQFHSPNTLSDEFLTLAPGTHQLRIKATDTAFKQSESNVVEVTVLPPDTQAPSTPLLSATVTGDDVHLSWTESSDDRAVWAYRLYRNGTLYKTITGGARAFDDVDIAVGTTHKYTVRAVDFGSNQSPLSNEVSATIGPDTVAPAAPELTATVQADGVHLSWTEAVDDRAGPVAYEVYRYYDRTDRIAEVGNAREYVDTTQLPEATYRYSVAATDAASNRVTSNRVDVRIGEPDLEPPTAPVLTVTATNLSAKLTWTESTDDRGLKEYGLYRDGQAVQFLPASGPREATFSLPAGTYTFKVQAVDKAQKLGEFSNEVTVTLAPPTTKPPGISALTLAPDNNDIRVMWSDATGDAPISEYRLYRNDTLIHTATASAPHTYWDVNMAPGTYRYRAVSVDTDGGTLTSGEAVKTIAPDTSAPTAALTSACGTVQGTVDVTGTIGDDRGPLTWRLELDGQTIAGPFDVTAPTASVQRAWDTNGVSNGSHQLRLAVRDGGGNETSSAPCAVDVQNVVLPSGLVAAYGFEQASGTSVTDSSGKGSTGTVSGATWVDGGRFGRALSFDGLNDLVTVPDSNVLDLTPGMTVEAWVKPASIAGWRTVLLKERPGSLVYALYGSVDNGRPSTELFTGAMRETRGTSALPVGVWSHLAASYDGTTLRLYVNGTQVSSVAQSGALTNSAGALRIGGNTVWGDEYFSGLIDEVRVYERALSAAEIQADRDRPVVPGT
jgi:fibronectin type 3 domain-containing protein